MVIFCTDPTGNRPCKCWIIRLHPFPAVLLMVIFLSPHRWQAVSLDASKPHPLQAVADTVYISRPFFPSRHTRPAPLHCRPVVGFSWLPPVVYPRKACKPFLGHPVKSSGPACVSPLLFTACTHARALHAPSGRHRGDLPYRRG